MCETNHVKTTQLYFLSLLSGLLFTFSWFPHGFVPLLFVAFIPLLIVEHEIFKTPQQYKSLTLFACSFLAFFTWNILTTWWVHYASFGGAIMAIVCNALLMTTVFMMFHKVKKRLGIKWGIPLFISFWISFEYFHLNWDLTWPWLTLGNAFADTPNWIQWYEFTGVFGGSLWVLLVNCFLFLLLFTQTSTVQENFKSNKMKIIGLVILIILPIIISVLMAPSIKEADGEKVNVVIVQPNVDPYNEKFYYGFEKQLVKMLELAAAKVDSTTDYLVFPETALTEFIWERQLDQSRGIQIINEFSQPFPKLKIIIGASTAKRFLEGETLSESARKFTDAEAYYDFYNTAFQFDSTGIAQIYHKSKLVPGVEKMPFPFILKYFSALAIDLGGTVGSLGTQEDRSVFFSSDSTIKVAPVICYESIYGEYVAGFVKNGAQFISIITNDGWWENTAGYKQLLKYGALRAIETRRYIVRSANVGVACFINHKGEIQQPTEYDTPSVLKGTIQLNTQQTFYTTNGDYIARFALLLSIAMIIYSWLVYFKVVKKE